MKPCTTCPADRQRSEEASHDRYAIFPGGYPGRDPSEPIAPGAAGRSVGTPQAAAELAQAPATRADRVELNAPRQALDPVRMEAAGSELDSSVELLLILFRIAQKARELGVLQRDNENQAIIHAQKAQVDEMRSGATLMIAMAVIAGVGALASAVVGSLGALKNGKAISQEKTLQKNIDGRNELIDAKMQALGKTSDEDRKIVGSLGGGPGAGQCGVACGGPCLREPQRRPCRWPTR